MPNRKSMSRARACRILSTVLLCGFPFYDLIAADSLSRLVAKQFCDCQKLEIRETDETVLDSPDWLTTSTSRDPGNIRVPAILTNSVTEECTGLGNPALYGVDRGQRRYMVEPNVRASMDCEE